MAIIDTFLKLMVERRAERLVLVSDRAPFLLMQGETIELSMPALREDMLRRISSEMIGDGERYEGEFHAANHVEFGYRIQPGVPEWRIEIHTLGAAPREVPAEQEALTRAVADFVQPSSKPESVEALGTEPPPGRPDPELVALLDTALLQNASDLFLSSGKPPRIRRNGLIIALDAGAPGRQQILGLVPDEAARRELERAGSVDFAVRWEMPDGPRRIRINVFRHLDGVAAALRPIRRRAPQLSELSLPEDLHQLATFPSGLVLVTGVAGSGKSTTLAALVDHLIREGHDHFMRNAMLAGGEDGMITLERSLATLVRDRLIDRETAIRTATDPKVLLHLLE